MTTIYTNVPGATGTAYTNAQGAFIAYDDPTITYDAANVTYDGLHSQGSGYTNVPQASGTVYTNVPGGT